ncbi:MAG: hypothetical protein ACOVNU_13645 [Candidatus Kapaibacteriota bacterium]|jgi:hypothetical protein
MKKYTTLILIIFAIILIYFTLNNDNNQINLPNNPNQKIAKIDSITEVIYDTIYKDITPRNKELKQKILPNKSFIIDTILNLDTIKINYNLQDSIFKLNISYHKDTIPIISTKTREIKLIELSPIIENKEKSIWQDIEYYMGCVGLGVIIGVVVE